MSVCMCVCVEKERRRESYVKELAEGMVEAGKIRICRQASRLETQRRINAAVQARGLSFAIILFSGEVSIVY